MILRKKLALIFALAISNVAISQDRIIFTWTSYVAQKLIAIKVTAGENFIINWGDGSPIEIKTGTGDYELIYYTYATNYTYNVTIIANDKNCRFIGFACPDNQIKNLDVNSCTALQYLYCYQNQIKKLVVNNCIMLQEFSCYSNQLTVLDVSTNTALRHFVCDNNQLTNLNVSGAMALQHLHCGYNQLEKLDISDCTQLSWLECYDNRLSLSDLFDISKIAINSFSSFGIQTLLPQSVALGVALFSDQSVFNGKYTEYIVTQNGKPASESAYTVTDGMIAFNIYGTYTVTMINEAVVSYDNCPAAVIVEINAGNVGISESILSDITVYPNPTTGQLTIVPAQSLTEAGESPTGSADKRREAITNVEIYDTTSRTVGTYSICQESTIDISHLPAGVYFVQIKTGESKTTKKILKM